MILIDLSLAWINDDVTVQPIYNDHIAVLDRARNVFGTNHGWDPQCPRHDCRVAGPAAQIGCQPLDELGIHLRGIGWRDLLSNDYDWLTDGGDVWQLLAQQMAQRPLGNVFNVSGPLLHVLVVGHGGQNIGKIGRYVRHGFFGGNVLVFDFIFDLTLHFRVGQNGDVRVKYFQFLIAQAALGVLLDGRQISNRGAEGFFNSLIFRSRIINRFLFKAQIRINQQICFSNSNTVTGGNSFNST